MSGIETTKPDGTEGDSQRRTPGRAALASFMGSAVEYYDFFLFGTAAALIFPKVFFPSGDDASQVLSFATFGVAYVARPVGAFVLGHFGDRIGRRNVLMFTLVLMGVSTFAIGCLPTYAAVGWLAPALLVLCRLLQGFSAAGEQAGASSLTLEHAPDHRRAYFTSWTLTGTQGGLILASLVMIPFVSLPDDAELSWGWRVPFWLSAIVVVVAYFIRRRLHETPEFDEAKATGAIARMPLKPLLQNHWKDVLRVFFCAFIAAVSTVIDDSGHRLRQEGRAGLRHHRVAGRGRQRLRAGHPTAVRHARRQDRAQAGLHLRRVVVGGHVAVLPAVDERRQHRAHLRAGRRSRSPSDTAPRTRSGRPSTARCSAPRCGSPVWRSAPSSASWLPASHRRS